MVVGMRASGYFLQQECLRAGLENQLPHHVKDTLRLVLGARLINLQSKKQRTDCRQGTLRS